MTAFCLPPSLSAKEPCPLQDPHILLTILSQPEPALWPGWQVCYQGHCLLFLLSWKPLSVHLFSHASVFNDNCLCLYGRPPLLPPTPPHPWHAQLSPLSQCQDCTPLVLSHSSLIKSALHDHIPEASSLLSFC